MSDFKVGDRVRITSAYGSDADVGREGTLVEIVENDTWPYKVDVRDHRRQRWQFHAHELEKVPSKPLAFRVGDKVASIHDTRAVRWTGTVVETHPNSPNGEYRVRYDKGGHGRYKEGELQYAPIPDKPKFKKGDRVRILTGGAKGDIATVSQADGSAYVNLVDIPTWRNLRSAPGPWTYSVKYLEAVPSQEFKLRVGDKIRNNLTGREGAVWEAPVSRTLKVYDLKPPYKDGVPVAAVEEYEFWHPGTYEHTHRAHKIGPF